MKMKKLKVLEVSDVTLEILKNSIFGCRNCLYSSIECNGGSNFQPAITKNGEATCKGYAYYD